MFLYCGNNPVNRIDPTGEAWWHWVLGAAVVAVMTFAFFKMLGNNIKSAGAEIGTWAQDRAAEMPSLPSMDE